MLRILLLILACPSPRLNAQIPMGDYVIVPSLGDDINRAIERVTADFNFIKRPIARKRLRATNPQPKSVSFSMVADSVEVVFNRETVLRVKPDGQPIVWRGFNGETLKVTSTAAGDVLNVNFVSDDGEKHNTYHLRGDGLLELNVRVSSPKLKHDLVYTNVFRRAGQ